MKNSLQRFLDAQEDTYQVAFLEIKNGRKRSHWMWYIFPQIQGLAFSETSRYFAIKDIEEAEAFVKHPILGRRLIDICNELIKLKSNDANQVFGNPDDLKLKSSMTLFASVSEADQVFQLVLDKYFNGTHDDKTLQIISKK